MKKHTLTFNRVKYVLSEGQFFFLTRATVPAKDVLEFGNKARMRGLMLKKLFEFNGRSYKRTDLGNDLLRAFKQRDKVREIK